MKKRVSRYMLSTECPLCHGKRLRRESLSVKFAGLDIADISRLPLEAACRHPASLCRMERRPGPGEAGSRASGKGHGRPADRPGSGRPARGPARPRPRLSLAGAQHAHPLARRAPAPAAGHAGALQPVRRGLRARRAVGRPASRRYRGAAARARPAEGLGQFAVRRRARARRDPPCRLDRRCRPRRRRAGRASCSTAVRPKGLAQVEESQTRRHLFGRFPPAERRAPKGWLR